MDRRFGGRLGQGLVNRSLANDSHRATCQLPNSLVAMCNSTQHPEIHYSSLLYSITDMSFEIKAELRQSLATFSWDESNNERYD
jgi:hypothetical protein